MEATKNPREIICVECGNNWYFSEKFEARLRERFGEDYAPPKRCYDCRQARKTAGDRPHPAPG